MVDMVFYHDDSVTLERRADKVYLTLDGQVHTLSDDPRASSLYIKTADRKLISIYQAFSVNLLCYAAKANDTIKMITGHEYDFPGILKLIRKAIDLGMPDQDIGYLEARCFMDYLQDHSAFSEETAIDLSEVGLKNSNIMFPLVHAKKVGETTSGRFYIRQSTSRKALAGAGSSSDAAGSSSDAAGASSNSAGASSNFAAGRGDEENFFRLISNDVRFGIGYRKTPGGRQYYAWHGYPRCNDDFITYAEISREEFEAANSEYPRRISADRDTAELFRQKYVNGHPVLIEGWNVSLR